MCDKATWRGVTVCAHMVPDLDAIAHGVGSQILLKPFLSPPSGSYQTSTSASIGTHAGGGAIDFDMSAYTFDDARHVETIARSHLKLAYARAAISGLWKQHVHVLDPNCHDLSSAAQAQFPRWQQGLNNLANNGADAGVRTWVTKTMGLFNTRMSRPYPALPAPTAPTPQEDPFMSITVKNPGDGTPTSLEDALWSMWTYAIREWYLVTGKAMPSTWYDNEAPDGKVSNPLDGTAWEIPTVMWSIWWHVYNGASAASSLAKSTETPPTPTPAPPGVPFHGVDVSKYQDSVLATWIASEDFLISKATEGKSFNAPSYPSQIAAIRAAGKKAGAYHYAWPENGWQVDFNHFVSVAGLKVGEVGALDFEPWSSKQPNADPKTFPAYIVGWADAFKARFGVDPLFYAPDYFVRLIKTNATPEQWARISALPFWKPGKGGVYVSDPSVGYGDTFGFQTLAMWQWTSTPLDRNILYVDWASIAVKTA